MIPPNERTIRRVAGRSRPLVHSTTESIACTILVVTIIRDTRDGWIMSARWPARRRRRFRLGLLLYLVGLRRLAVRVSGVPTGDAKSERYALPK